MKITLTCLLLLLLITVRAQCFDVYKNPAKCATFEDSLMLYNNAVKVINFYENNKDYVKTEVRQITSEYDKVEIFKQLADARRLFKIIRAEFPASNKKYKDITYAQYYKPLDKYRFYQRELENQLVNADAEISLYDYRISPLVVNFYKNTNPEHSCYSDIVNIPLYAPVVVKPFMLLSDSELVLRNAILHIENAPVYKIAPVFTPAPTPLAPPIADTSGRKRKVGPPKLKYNSFCPVYYFESPELGGPALIGTINGRHFVRIRPEDYKEYAVPVWAQRILADIPELTKYLKLIYGEYLLDVY